MKLPRQAIFAFNANIDHLKSAGEEDILKIEQEFPEIASAMSESFSWGVQREMAIEERACKFFLSNFEFEMKIVGGQAGNAAEQASALGVECYLHTNFANSDLVSLFSHPEKIFLASENGFVRANELSALQPSAHHFVFENKESRTRFIASYDPFPLHPDSNFCRNIQGVLPQIDKAFVGGLHLAKSPAQLQRFLDEMKKWKEANPSLLIFFEMGEFLSREVLKAAESEIFSIADIVGLNEVELASLGFELHDISKNIKTALFHTPEEQQVFPHEKTNAAALEFARRCASFFAQTGRRAGLEDIVGYKPQFIGSPKRTVGLGDTFSCAYFLAV
ncbi:MAG: hypothetical protein N3G22_01390 [Candidatus Micrarchaeota archaeon]|nr:hypothetical protein [Candidatus Micrarchaeota archaeon]